VAGVSYQERQRSTRSDLLLILASILFTVVGVLMFRDGERWAAAMVAVAGAFLLDLPGSRRRCATASVAGSSTRSAISRNPKPSRR
jgi:hypothetical protein